MEGKAVRSATNKITESILINNIIYMTNYREKNMEKAKIGYFLLYAVSLIEILSVNHNRLDVILDEEHSRNRIENSINNLSRLRKIVFNLASLDDSFGKITLKRKLTNYVLDFSKIERLIFKVIPSLNNCQ